MGKDNDKLFHLLSWVCEDLHPCKDLHALSDAVCTLVLPEEEEVCPEKLTWIEAHGSDCRRVEAFAKECLLK